MRQFMWNYANGIFITNGDYRYIDSLHHFTYDCCSAGLKLIKPFPTDVFEVRIVDSLNPNDCYAKTRQFGQVGIDTVGIKKEDFMVFMEHLNDLMMAKKKRIGYEVPIPSFFPG